MHARWPQESLVRGQVHGPRPHASLGGLAEKKMHPYILEKYNGMINLTEFLQIYATTFLDIRGDKKVMANYFYVALTSSAQSWLINLSKASIWCCEELYRQFMSNFEGTYSQPSAI